MTPALASLLAHRRDTLAAAAPATAAALASDPALSSEADRVLVASDFVARVLGRDDALLPALLAEPARFRSSRQARDYRRLIDDVTPVEPDAAAELVFMARCGACASARWCASPGAISPAYASARRDAARDCPRFADERDPRRDRVRARVASRYGTPRAAVRRQTQELVVLGMGKLGGGELNFSSDVDLVFLFPEARRDRRRRPARERGILHARRGSLVIRLLDARTDDGFVFRVDMRLRPFGDSGPLVASFAAFEDYLQRHGRDWERYAWVKARALTGAARFAAARTTNVVAAVRLPPLPRLRRVRGLREMKALIARDVERRELAETSSSGPAASARSSSSCRRSS